MDDDAETVEVVTRALERDGHEVQSAQTVTREEALRLATHVDLVVLDVMLGTSSGIEICAHMRQQGLKVPVLFLSARGAVNSRVEGLDAGGDDYLPKPFALRELVARVRALGRRGHTRLSPKLELGMLTLNFETRRALVEGVEVPVTGREWDILRALVNAQGAVLSFDEVLERAWGEVSERGRASLEVIISRLRRKLQVGAGRPLIRTVRGTGYALDLDL